MSVPKKFERLPSDVKPLLYDLFLEPDLHTFKFNGKEIVSVEVKKSVDKIILNCKELCITKAQLKPEQTGHKVMIPDISMLKEEETLVLQFSEQIPIGNAELTIEFNGELNDKLEGFYRSKCVKTAEQEEKYFAVTQFEACDARSCFPCWDEPAIKARFDITLSVDSTKLALSNMPVEKETETKNGRKLVKFARTPIMSTYLVAFVVGDFDYLEETTCDGIIVRVYTPVGKKEQGRFALYVAAKVLPYYKEYFQIAYPLPKMDLIAISELAAGAMENWGLVTYRETCLLVDENNTSAVTKQNIALTVGHELAHQWFGNLVTMEWWTHLWLNEGYATFLELFCVDYLFPEYDIWTQFVTDYYCRALELDALKSSHPIEVPVEHPSEVEEIFDEISYSKGASVIRMLHRYIGEDDFKKGLTLYLKRHMYGNTFTEDLWAALEEESSKPIRAVMFTWTKQIGFPVITVEKYIKEGDSHTFILSQSKFCSDAAQKDEQTLWMIPIIFCSKSNPNKECFSMIMETRQCKITIPNVPSEDWIKLNQGTVGFYRVKYPSTMLQQFVPSIEDKSLPPLDRLGILDDLFALLQGGQASTVDALNLIWAMKNEDNYTVWMNISTCLEKIYNLLINTDCLDLFEAYGRQVMKVIYEKLGYENSSDESHITTLLRSLVLQRLVKFGATDFRDVVRDKFERHSKGINNIPADQRTFVYKTVLMADGKQAFNELMKLYQQTDLQEEKERIVRTFSAVVDPDLVDNILEFIQSDGVSPPLAVTAICSIASSKVGRMTIFNFVKNNYDKLYEKYLVGSLLARIIKYTMENFASKEKANEIETFFTNKNTSGVERTVQQSIETIKNNAAWLQRDGESVKNYLLNLKLCSS